MIAHSNCWSEIVLPACFATNTILIELEFFFLLLQEIMKEALPRRPNTNLKQFIIQYIAFSFQTINTSSFNKHPTAFTQVSVVISVIHFIINAM